jgi:DNA polymerase (family X)
MDNQKIADIFQEIGDILEIQGANRFRVLAYQKAARIIADMPKDLSDIYRKDPRKLEEIPGIGKDLAGKITELIKTGKCKFHEDLLKHFDKGLLEILRVRGIGPKKVQLFYAKLGIDSIAKLKKAASDGQLRDLPGMGEKSEEDIIKSLGEYDMHTERMMLITALKQAEEIVTHMKKCKFVTRAQYAGSLRRMKDTIGDIDVLASAKNPKKESGKIMDHFIIFGDVASVIAHGDTKTSVILASGVQADLRVIDEKIFGAALHYFTGSKAHNITIRDRAKKKGLKVNEYGVFKLKPKEILIGGKTEEEVFKAVGLPYIEPELREDRGEIEAALKGRLPKIVDLKDLRGDLHVHSRWSDGATEIEEIARAYMAAGFSYIAMTDHSPSVSIAHGLTPDRFKMQWDEIDEINNDFEKEAGASKSEGARGQGAPAVGARPFKILKGVECDILPDGKMDLPDSILKKMDIVIASVHSRFNMTEKEQTERVLRAFKNPYVKIFGHPTGRLINQREPYQIDMERIIDAAIKEGIALEIDSQPSRLDLYDYYCKMAKDKGAKFTVDSDAHAIPQMGFLRLGVSVARRGWLEKKDILNTLPPEKLFDYWKSKKRA